LGEQFVRSEAFRWLQQNKQSRPQRWQTPSAELYLPSLHAATLTTVSGGGDTLVAPDDRGVVPAPAPPPMGVADLLGGGPTDSNAIFYLVETAFTNAADTVAEGAAKPESALEFTPRTDPVRKIATWIPVTDEMLEDVAQIRSYIDSRLRVGVATVEDDQLLNGSGNSPNIEGILQRDGLAAAIARGGDESNADAIARQISAIQIATSLEVTGIVMNPLQWASISVAKDDAGSYLSGGPFATLPRRRLWGVDVVLSANIAAGTALVGAFKTAAGAYRKGGIRVEASNSHSDFFVKNLVAIRAETRLALAVYRPAAFGLVTGLDEVVS
jgi:HK97 family phage major capsid protein